MTELNDVFVPGGQPIITFVERSDNAILKSVEKAIKMPNRLVSISGPSKVGKTVLCRKALQSKQYVWVDGGRVSTASEFWGLISSELNVASEESRTFTDQISGGGKVSIPLVVTTSGSVLLKNTVSKVVKIDGMNAVTKFMVDNKVLLVIDDFHYIKEGVRTEILRNLKGYVFNGLKVVLLSANHRVFDAIKAESELTGRLTSVTIPEWSNADIRQIPKLGFKALNIECPETIISTMVSEAQSNPMLMQSFCWELCDENNIAEKKAFSRHTIGSDFDLKEVFQTISADAGLPIYQKLRSGPQAKKERKMRPLKGGGEVDKYEAILLAIANTGPKSTITYEELRAELFEILENLVPQKHEVTSALKYLTEISQGEGMDSALDWDEDSRILSVTAPYLRFYLRWQISKEKD